MRKAASVSWRASTLSSTLPRPLFTAQRPSAVVLARPFSATRSPSFFFRKPTKSSTDLAQELLDAKKRDRPDVLVKLYPLYVDSLSPSSSSSSSSHPHTAPLSQDDLRSLMRYAANTRRFHLALRIFNDLPAVFRFPQGSHDHHNLVLAMVRSDRLTQAEQWLVNLERDFPGRKPHVSDWNLVLSGYRKRGDLDGMRNVVEGMRSTGCTPSVVSYNTFITALFEQGKVKEVRTLVGEMRERGVEGDVFTETALLTGYTDARELGSAREVRDRLEAAVEANLSKGKKREVDGIATDNAAVNALVKFEAADQGYPAGLKLAKRYRDVGIELEAWTVNTLVVAGAKTLRTAEEGVRLIEEVEPLVQNSRADRRAWSSAIVALSSTGELDEALKLYQLARDRSILPDSRMVQPLLTALINLASSSSTHDSEDPLLTVKTLYEDLSTSSRTYATSPDASLFTTLLRACANPSHPDLAWSRTLISDMKERGVKLDGPSVTWHIVALMRAAQTWDEAFSSYDTIRALDPSVLDLSSYNTILAGFTSLSPPSSADEPAAPAPLVQEFLSDMRTTSHPPNSITYSLLLTYYSRSLSANPSTIAHLHSLIKLDVHLDPDTALFNSLMDAYSRGRAFSAAYRVWDSLVVNARYAGAPGIDQTTLSILLDTCGYDGSPGAKQRARKVWGELEAGSEGGAKGGAVRVVRNRKNWDSWVECLARWGEWEEVEDVVFRRMQSEDGVPKASLETVQTVLKMARKVGDERVLSVAKKVKERTGLWKEVKELALLPRWEVEEVETGKRREQPKEEGTEQ